MPTVLACNLFVATVEIAEWGKVVSQVGDMCSRVTGPAQSPTLLFYNSKTLTFANDPSELLILHFSPGMLYS